MKNRVSSQMNMGDVSSEVSLGVKIHPPDPKSRYLLVGENYLFRLYKHHFVSCNIENGISDLGTGIWTRRRLRTGIWIKIRLGTGIWYPPSGPSKSSVYKLFTILQSR